MRFRKITRKMRIRKYKIMTTLFPSFVGPIFYSGQDTSRLLRSPHHLFQSGHSKRDPQGKAREEEGRMKFRARQTQIRPNRPNGRWTTRDPLPYPLKVFRLPKRDNLIKVFVVDRATNTDLRSQDSGKNTERVSLCKVTSNKL